ncbi:DUF2381 family protein [Hyalangium versicolor]|uniref:DUF2381 family protein n=1 Tax=Hyalangium versicolor TaxID=2861190 RepID=UPI001CC9FCF2|nr:DUF2381 family protein [Hyalangium versicolor]
MLQPATRAWVVVLLVMTTAEAQPQSLRGRSVTLSGSPLEPPPEVRVAASIPLVLLFDAPIDKDSLQLDASRLQLIATGESSLVIAPVVSPSEKERWVLRVRYADGARPEWAVLVLVSRPPEVDGRIDVVRRPQSLEACQAALAEARAQAELPRAEVWELADRLGGGAVQAQAIDAQTRNTLHAKGTVYLLATGLLLDFQVRNPPDLPAWTPIEAVLRSETNGALVPVRTMAVKPGRIAPGEEGRVAVDAELPSPGAGRVFTLEVRDASGRGFTLDSVQLPAAPAKTSGGQ